MKKMFRCSVCNKEYEDWSNEDKEAVDSLKSGNDEYIMLSFCPDCFNEYVGWYIPKRVASLCIN